MRSLSNTVKRGRLRLEPYLVGGKAARLITQSELNEILERKTAEAFDAGFQQGSAEGYERGEREGSQRASEEIAAQLKRDFAGRFAAVDKLVGEITAAREGFIRSAEREAVALGLTIASRVLCREVAGSSLTPELVEEAMRQTMGRKLLVVRLNPADREAMARDGQRIETMFANAESVEFIDDPAVSRGGCVIESNMGIVDAQLDRQIEQLRQALLV